MVLCTPTRGLEERDEIHYPFWRCPHQAHVNYACPCGCIAGVIYDEAVPLEKPGSCCCGRLLVVGPGAQQRLESSLPGDEAFDLDPGTVKLPWDEVVETALAVPRE